MPTASKRLFSPSELLALYGGRRYGRGTPPPVNIPSPRPKHGRTRRQAKTTPGIASYRALDDAETRALLEPWFGPDLPVEALPIPRLIQVVEGEPGWFFAAEGALAVGTPWADAPGVDLWLGLKLAPGGRNPSILVLRDKEAAHGA